MVAGEKCSAGTAAPEVEPNSPTLIGKGGMNP